MPDVLVDAEGADAVEAGLVGGKRLQQLLDRPPRGPQLAGEALHGGVFAAHLPNRPPARSSRQQGPRAGQLLVAFGEGTGRAVRLGAPPGPLAPHQFDRSAHGRDVDQPDLPPAVTAGHDTTRPAGLDPRGRLDHDTQQQAAFAVVLTHGDDVEAVQADEQIAAITGGIRAAARSSTRRRLGQRQEPSGWQLGRYRSSEGLGPIAVISRSRVAHTHPGTKSPFTATTACPWATNIAATACQFAQCRQ